MKNFTFINNIKHQLFCTAKSYLHTDVEKAVEISVKTEKLLFFLFFTGSDWCGWCKRLVSEVFQKEEFKNWAKDNVVLVELDFPKRKKLSEKLQVQNNNSPKTIWSQRISDWIFC